MTSFYGGGAPSTGGGGSAPTKGALIFKGTLGISDDGATVLALPDTHEEGWTYLVVTAGTYAGQLCEEGDFVICVNSGEAASDLDWTVVQGNTFSTLPAPTALDEGKIISVDASGNYVLIDNPSSGETENLPDPSEADEGKILSVGADGNYILTDNSAKDKLDKANPTYTGSLTGENAAFSGIVTVATPAADGEAANKGYVDATKTELEGDINTLQQTVTSQTETINTLNQQVTNITGGTVELPYLKNTGDSGTGVYDFTGATVNAADPVDNSNVATKHYVDQKVASAGGGSGEVVSYTQGDGISISLENEISLSIDSAGANGLKVGTNGLGLDLATTTTPGAMAASDKTAIASNTTEITNIKNGTTELPYLKETNPTYEGTLIGGDATFTGSVQVSTPDQDNEAANKSYVDTALAEAKSYTDDAVSGIASDETIQQIQSDIENIKDGTTVLPYLSSAGGTMTGSIDAGENTVTNLKEPEEGTDATTKNYVDEKVAQAAPVSIMPIPEVSGENLIQIKDSVEWPFQGLKVYGKSVQDGTPSPENPIPIVSAGGDGSIVLTISDGAEQSQSLTVSTLNGLPGIPVDSGGNYTDAEGQQWVCDEVDFARGVYVQRLFSIIGRNVSIYYDDNNRRQASFTLTHFGKNTVGLSNRFVYRDIQLPGYFSIDPAGNTMYMRFELGTSLEQINQILQNSIFIYELANPIITPFSPEEIAAYRALHTYDGTTIISTDEDISGLKVKYVAKAIDYQQSINAAIQETNDKIDAVYNQLVKKAESVDEVNQLFKDWWNANWEEGSSTYNDMLERWFGKVLDDDKVYGVKLPLFETSTSPQGEYIEDSVGAIVTPATEEDPGQNDFAKTPQFWCVEVAAEKNADGSHTIYACEFIDDINVVRNGGPDNGKHLVWVLQKNTYIHEYEESGYSYIKIQCHPANSFVQWPQGTDRTGHTYSYIANPKYAAGIDDGGNIGCRTGLKPTCYMSMNETIQAWRARGPQYSGSSACFYKWAYIMYALLTTKKGEDVGCNNYNYQYAAAVSESRVSRIILTAEQANNLYVGSNVIIGNTEGDNDRNQAAMYSLVKLRKISSIEEVSIEEDASSYKAVYIDVPDETTFDTTVGTTYISTMPYYSGWTDTVKGTIGTKYNTNLNKQPFLLQKVELMNGAYNYASDELDQWSQQDDTHYLYDFYLCEDQTKVSTNGTITSDYIKKENATLTIDTAVYTANSSWYYIEDNLTDNNFKMLTPKKFSSSAGSGTGTRDAFYLNYAASGVRAPMVWANLQDGGRAGLSCRASHSSPSWPLWGYAGGCPGLSG